MQLQGGIEKVVRYDGHCKNCEYNVCLKYNKRGKKESGNSAICLHKCLLTMTLFYSESKRTGLITYLMVARNPKSKTTLPEPD